MYDNKKLVRIAIAGVVIIGILIALKIGGIFMEKREDNNAVAASQQAGEGGDFSVPDGYMLLLDSPDTVMDKCNVVGTWYYQGDGAGEITFKEDGTFISSKYVSGSYKVFDGYVALLDEWGDIEALRFVGSGPNEFRLVQDREFISWEFAREKKQVPVGDNDIDPEGDIVEELLLMCVDQYLVGSDWNSMRADAPIAKMDFNAGLVKFYDASNTETGSWTYKLLSCQNDGLKYSGTIVLQNTEYEYEMTLADETAKDVDYKTFKVFTDPDEPVFEIETNTPVATHQ